MDPRTIQAAATAAANGLPMPPGLVLDEATKNAMQYFINQQYNFSQSQSNDTIILTQNALAAGIPTLHKPTIMSYLGYGNSEKPKEQNFAAKYAKLLEVIDEIGRDIRPLYSSSKSANDRLRRQIMLAKQLVRECLVEVDRTQR